MNWRILVSALGLSLMLVGPSARAADLSTLQLLTQSEFRLLSEDLAGAAALKVLSPAVAPRKGFEVSASWGNTQLENPQAWRAASGGKSVFTSHATASVRLARSLGLGLDVGVSAGKVENTGAILLGADLRWSLVPQASWMPGLGLRASRSMLRGNDQLRLGSTTMDVLVSKSFGSFTPYLAAGLVRTESTPLGISSLKKESFDQRRVTLGGHMNFGAVDLSVEADVTGRTQTGSGRLSYQF